MTTQMQKKTQQKQNIENSSSYVFKKLENSSPYFSENLKSGHFVLQISPQKKCLQKKIENTMTKPTENSSK